MYGVLRAKTTPKRSLASQKITICIEMQAGTLTVEPVRPSGCAWISTGVSLPGKITSGTQPPNMLLQGTGYSEVTHARRATSSHIVTPTGKIKPPVPVNVDAHESWAGVP